MLEENTMKRMILSLFLTALASLALSITAFGGCSKIQGGTIMDSQGNAIKVGYDKWGYNYQAHMFNGLYDNFSRPTVPITEGDLKLEMKWSDDWLSNQDCNGDLKLDRGYDAKTGAIAGFSKGWLTNHFEGDYVDAGESYHYTEFTKIVYDGGAACGAGSDSCLWGVYTIIEDVINDAHGGFHGVQKSTFMNPAGLGYYTN